MPVDINRLQNENAKAIAALNNSITRLMDLSDDGLPLPDVAAVNAQLIRAQADKIHFQTVRAHLDAATVMVGEMDAAAEGRLNTLAARLDNGIRNDFRINATIGMIRVVLDAAEEVAEIARSHS